MSRLRYRATVGVVYEAVKKIVIAEDSPSPCGRGQGEGLRICTDFHLGFALSGSRSARPSPAASRRPLPEGEGLAPHFFRWSYDRAYS
jgi:hypothetical protein